MSFSIRKSASRPWPVKFSLLSGDSEGEVTSTEYGFVLNFIPFSEAQFLAIIEEETPEKFRVVKVPEQSADAGAALPSIPELPKPTTVETLAINARIFPRLVDGWSKVNDEDGNPAVYSAEAFAALITGPDGLAICGGINHAIAQMRFGIAPAKNAQASPAPGLAPAADGAASTS